MLGYGHQYLARLAADNLQHGSLGLSHLLLPCRLSWQSLIPRQQQQSRLPRLHLPHKRQSLLPLRLLLKIENLR